MSDRQALGIDINEWSRTGGVNYDLVKRHIRAGVYDFLIIKAGLGNNQSPLLEEQKREAERHGIPFVTYHLLDPGVDIKEQTRKYVEWVGTGETAYILDVESPYRGHQPPNRAEVLRSIDEIARLTQKGPVIYSRVGMLDEINFLDEARHFPLWIAQYPWDISQLPSRNVQYQYFHEFTRDFSDMLPPSAHRAGIAGNVILWQFSERGRGRYYLYNANTADPRFPQGLESADLNISIKGRGAFMQLMFGGIPAIEEAESQPARVEQDVQPAEFTYPGMTNQDMINLIYFAARPFTRDPWADWIRRAKLESLIVPNENRSRPYTGPRIEDFPNLTPSEKRAILAAKQAQDDGVQPGQPTYPGMTNQDMINLIFTAAGPFTEEPWVDWVLRANLGFLAVPSGNRRKPYIGPRIEDLPNLTDRERGLILILKDEARFS